MRTGGLNALRMAYVLTAIVGVTMLVMTLIPQPPADPGIAGGDKLFHVLGFFALVVPLALRHPVRWRLILTVALVFGGMIEIAQPYVGRSAEWLDLLADGVGASLGVAGAIWIRARNDRVNCRSGAS